MCRSADRGSTVGVGHRLKYIRRNALSGVRPRVARKYDSLEKVRGLAVFCDERNIGSTFFVSNYTAAFVEIGLRWEVVEDWLGMCVGGDRLACPDTLSLTSRPEGAIASFLRLCPTAIFRPRNPYSAKHCGPNTFRRGHPRETFGCETNTEN